MNYVKFFPLAILAVRWKEKLSVVYGCFFKYHTYRNIVSDLRTKNITLFLEETHLQMMN